MTIRNELLLDTLNANPTSFLLGRDFRAYSEIGLETGERLVFELTVPIDIFITSVQLFIDEGHVRYSVIAGGTSTGTFENLETVFNQNRRSDAGEHIRQVEVKSGGNVANGIETDVAVLKTGSNSQRVSVVDQAQGKRGLSAGTYHIVVENVGNATASGVIYANWSEWP